MSLYQPDAAVAEKTRIRRKAIVQSLDFGPTLKANDRLESAAYLAEKHGCSLQTVMLAQLAAALDDLEFPVE